MKYDAVIIGAGHNGLVAAAYLAMKGLRVAVFEKNAFIGGMASSPEIWRGYKPPLGAYVVSLFRREIASELGLFKLGLKVIPKNPNMINILENRKYIRIWSNPSKTSREIERFSKRDAKSYMEWSRFWESIGLLMDKVYMKHPQNIVDIIENLAKIMKTLKINIERINRFINDILWIINTPAIKILDEYFESDEVKASLVEDALIGEMVNPATPGTGLLMAHHYIGNITGNRGEWGYIEGGIGRLSELIARVAIDHGAEIYTNTEVDKIIVKKNQVAGIKVNGKVIESKIVISNLSIKNTFLHLLDEDAEIDSDILRRINALRSIGASSKILLALDKLPTPHEHLLDIEKELYASSTLYIPSLRYIEKAYGEALTLGKSKNPWFSINTPSFADPSIAPSGKHVVSIFLQYTPYSHRYDEDSKRDILESVIETIESHILRDISRHIIESRVITPLDIEKTFNVIGGNIFHISISPDQIFFNRPLPDISDFKTPIKNLYICGSSMHPGGGVSGVPGYLAAQKILGKNLRLGRKDLIEIALKIATKIR